MASMEEKRKIMSLVRKCCVQDLASQLETFGLRWFDCCYSTGDTLLHVAAKEGNIAVIKYLLESCQSEKDYVDIPNAAGKTPLHEACQNVHSDAVDYLLSKGANSRAIKQADWTPLMLACTRKGPQALQCCQLLLHYGGLPLLKDINKDGWNAFHIAARGGDLLIVKTLLMKDPSQAFVKSKNGRTSLHTAALHSCPEVVKLLLDCPGMDCNVRDSCGSTPLHDAVRSGSIETVTLLLKCGAELNAVNNQGYGVVHMAAEAGKHNLLDFLCVELDLPGMQSASSPLHCAVRSGQWEAAKVLLHHGADPTARDTWGRTCKDLIPDNISEDVQNKLKFLLL